MTNNGEAQLGLIKKLLAPLPHFMEMSEFGDALQAAFREFNIASMDSAERIRWSNCMVVIYHTAPIRFGSAQWIEYVKRNPQIYTTIHKID